MNEADWRNIVHGMDAAAERMSQSSDRAEHAMQRIAAMLEDACGGNCLRLIELLEEAKSTVSPVVKESLTSACSTQKALVPDNVVRELRQGVFIMRGLSPCGGFLQLDQVEANRISDAMDDAADVLDIILPAAPKPAAVPDDVARDAARYRWLCSQAEQGAVRTLLPLVRSHYIIVNESAHEYPDIDDAIDAAMLAASQKEGKV